MVSSVQPSSPPPRPQSLHGTSQETPKEPEIPAEAPKPGEDPLAAKKAELEQSAQTLQTKLIKSTETFFGLCSKWWNKELKFKDFALSVIRLIHSKPTQEKVQKIVGDLKNPNSQGVGGIASKLFQLQDDKDISTEDKELIVAFANTLQDHVPVLKKLEHEQTPSYVAIKKATQSAYEAFIKESPPPSEELQRKLQDLNTAILSGRKNQDWDDIFSRAFKEYETVPRLQTTTPVDYHFIGEEVKEAKKYLEALKKVVESEKELNDALGYGISLAKGILGPEPPSQETVLKITADAQEFLQKIPGDIIDDIQRQISTTTFQIISQEKHHFRLDPSVAKLFEELLKKIKHSSTTVAEKYVSDIIYSRFSSQRDALAEIANTISLLQGIQDEELKTCTTRFLSFVYTKLQEAQ